MDRSPPAPAPPERSALFPYWRETLARSRLPRGQRGRYAVEIGRFLRYCDILAVSATAAQARTYLATIPVSIHRPIASQALRWYFRAARRPVPPPPPPPALEPWWVGSVLPEEPEPPDEWSVDGFLAAASCPPCLADCRTL